MNDLWATWAATTAEVIYKRRLYSDAENWKKNILTKCFQIIQKKVSVKTFWIKTWVRNA